ncbi:hypothetical protein HAX54_008019 [Datura stramonium]|uniref:Uncharacterized protein n=1 Tax=Datura stramonium TaxID=4076 RepID=A0ABS8TDU9_DATST|nr:hypothetical protein [Datura stramonium]
MLLQGEAFTQVSSECHTTTTYNSYKNSVSTLYLEDLSYGLLRVNNLYSDIFYAFFGVFSSVSEWKDPKDDGRCQRPKSLKLELAHAPGRPKTFEINAKFCYGMNFDITTTNVARLHCVEEYLEMKEDYREENVIVRTETFLVEVVSPRLEKLVEVLSSCEAMLPTTEEVGILGRCIDAIGRNACQE